VSAPERQELPGWFTSPVGPNPIAARMQLGAHLRRLREGRGITRHEAGELIRASESKICRLELGRVACKINDVTDLLALYEADAGKLAGLLALAREANARGWWQAYGEATPRWFRRYLGLEASASLIRTYELQLVPGLLQTEEYARAVIRLGHPTAAHAEIEQRVRLRVHRQQALDRPDPPRLWAVVDETALRRPVGGDRVMRDQLESLIGIVTKRRDIRLQVVPLDHCGHAATSGSFTILRFPYADMTDLVYIEQLTNALYLDRLDDVDRYLDTMNQLCVEATSPQSTVEMLERIIGDLDFGH
jgi:transcriptional regulator with XRE-family HTH domain